MRPRRQISMRSILYGCMLVGAVGAGYVSDRLPLGQMMAMVPGSGCNIKGGISQDTGERVYHVPGQSDYNDTAISVTKGERWFCSEAQARRSGWRKAQI
ncbi:hypothetical protein SAMN05216176_111175 [Nitratireductor indicus]|nr:hypothetical protein SAMN05216176_111175 [Nitratireductor indicus]